MPTVATTTTEVDVVKQKPTPRLLHSQAEDGYLFEVYLAMDKPEVTLFVNAHHEATWAATVAVLKNIKEYVEHEYDFVLQDIPNRHPHPQE